MEAPLGHSRLSPEVWKEILSHLPMWWRAMCCRVCKVWQKDLEQPQLGRSDDILVEYGLGTLCSVLAAEGVTEVMRRIRLHFPSGIAEDLGRMDQVRRFVQRHRFRYAKIESVDEWMQLASQEPDAGWLCKGASKTSLERRGKRLMRQAVGKPQESKLLDTMRLSDRVYCACFSPDGSTIASACFDGTVRLLDAKKMEGKGMLTGHRGKVKCVAYSPDGKRIASAGSDKTVRVWDAATMEEVCSVRGHSKDTQGCPCRHYEDYFMWKLDFNAECPVTGHSVAYSPDGSQLATSGGCGDNTVRLWDPKTMEHKGTLTGHSSSVSSVAYSPDASTIVSGSWDTTVRLWDAMTMEAKGILTGHSGGVNSVAWSPDGEFITTAGYDETIRLWSKSGEHKGTLKGHSGEVLSVAYSPDSKSLASASVDTTVKLWDLSGETPVEKGTLTGHNIAVTCVAYSPDGKHIASASDDRTVKIWDAETKLGVCSVKGHSDWVHCVAYSPDGKHIASASCDTTIKIWDAETKQEVCTLTEHLGNVSSVAWSPDSEMVASGSCENTVCLWCKSGELKGILRGHSAAVNSVAFSPDSKYVASGSGEYDEIADDESDNSVRIWDVSTGEEVGTLTGHGNAVTRVAYSPDGRHIASADCDGTARIWDAVTMQKVCSLSGHVASWQHLDPETKALAAKVNNGESAGSNRTGQYIVTANHDMVYVYRTDSDGKQQGEPLACFGSPTRVRSVSCRGTSVVVGCQDGQVLFLEAPLLAGGSGKGVPVVL